MSEMIKLEQYCPGCINHGYCKKPCFRAQEYLDQEDELRKEDEK